MRNVWKQFRYRLELFGCLVIATLVPRLPRRACLRLARRLGRLHWRLDRRSRRVALANLEAAFGQRFTPEERTRVGRASFENFAAAMFDLFWAPRLRDAGTRARWIEMVGVEGAQATRARHGANLLIQTHLGSYELLSICLALAGLPVTIVMQDFKNPRLDAVFVRARETGGHRLIGQAQSMLKLLRAMRRGGGAGMLVDLNLKPGRHPCVAIEAFGGLRMCVTFLHALLHERTGVPLTPTSSLPQPDGTCRMILHPPLVFPPGATRQEITQGCWDAFEPLIRERPDLWLWGYKHFRYRPSDAPAPGRYPFYARTSREFDRITQGAG